MILRDPTYRYPEAPHAEEHDCPGCGDSTDTDLCPVCGDRYRDCGDVEYPELAADDAAWLDRVDNVLDAVRRARRAA